MTAPSVEKPTPYQHAEYGDWTIDVFDDLPVPEGRERAAEMRVVVALNGETKVEGTYPSYRIWTLLAHWSDDLPLEVGEPPC